MDLKVNMIIHSLVATNVPNLVIINQMLHKIFMEQKEDEDHSLTLTLWPKKQFSKVPCSKFGNH